MNKRENRSKKRIKRRKNKLEQIKYVTQLFIELYNAVVDFGYGYWLLLIILYIEDNLPIHIVMHI